MGAVRLDPGAHERCRRYDSDQAQAGKMRRALTLALPRERILATLAAALVGGAVAVWWQNGRGAASDLDQLLVGSRALLHHADAYSLVGPGKQFEWGFPLYYPATALALVSPLTLLTVPAARVVFVLLSCGVLGYAASVRRWHLVPMLAGTPFLMSAAFAQWSPLLTAVCAFPTLAWVWLAKPNFAVPFLLAGVPRRALAALAIGGGLLIGLTLWLRADWPAAWIRALGDNHSLSPLVLSPFGGPLLLIALLRWRSRDARLLLGLACIPQTVLLYNALPLFLVVHDRREAILLAVLSWCALAGQVAVGYYGGAPRIVHDRGVGVAIALLYLPALLMVLRNGARPEGGVGPT